ncbi:ABC transporter substrate-binding protein, partial [Nocardioides sp.]|uniref:ABC transporter substrate-binding protein n=1 Tax=Nocardioides sp. TaxID=35761 RepID=UPI002735C432
MPSTAMNSTLTTVGLAACALALSACGTGVAQETDGDSSAETVTIENCGTEREFPLAPEAVVGMAPAQTELLVRLGVADTLVGQAQVGMAPLPEDVAGVVKDVPVIGGDTPPSREELLSVEPDLVFSPTGYEFTAEQGFASMEQLEQVGAAAYLATGGCPERRMTGTVEDLFVDLENLGRIFEAEEAAADLEEQARAELDEVEAALADVEPVRMAQVYVDGESLSAIGAGIEYDIMARAGGDNVYAPDDEAFSSFFA